MLRVNGLFGWIEANDRKSLALFAGFLVAFHLAAALSLYFPLAAFDPDHAPVFNWWGYLTRYVPIATVVAAAAFGLQMAWHVRTVRRLVAFRFVDDAEEPRLCGIVEPLAIGMGLPAPYVGVIETPALNAFACGLRKADAVVVVTRGLIEELDDDELAAVVAHELAHIANGDIRLMAAANVCLNMIGWILKPRGRQQSKLMQIASFPILIVLFPPVLAFVLLVGLLAQTALNAGRLIRMLISTSREFVADARAVEATQNPAALVAALGKVAGRSRIADMPPGQDAMMIDGDVEGMFATHPTMAERVKAIVAVTGSMVHIAPARRDTRIFGRRPAGSAIRAHAPVATPAATARIDGADARNWLGLTREMTYGAAAGVAALLAVNLGDPAKALAALDPRPFNSIIIVSGRGVACSVDVMIGRKDSPGHAERCAPGKMKELMASYRDKAGPFASMFDAMAEDGGTFSSKSAAARPK